MRQGEKLLNFKKEEMLGHMARIVHRSDLLGSRDLYDQFD
jgi:hypothetical protein